MTRNTVSVLRGTRPWITAKRCEEIPAGAAVRNRRLRHGWLPGRPAQPIHRHSRPPSNPEDPPLPRPGVLATVLLASLAPIAGAQTWTLDQTVGNAEVVGELDVAVSEGGRFATLFPYRTTTGKRRTALTTYEADSAVAHKVSLSSFDSLDATFYGSLFLDE